MKMSKEIQINLKTVLKSFIHTIYDNDVLHNDLIYINFIFYNNDLHLELCS